MNIDPIKEGINAAGPAKRQLPRPMLGIFLSYR